MSWFARFKLVNRLKSAAEKARAAKKAEERRRETEVPAAQERHARERKAEKAADRIAPSIYRTCLAAIRNASKLGHNSATVETADWETDRDSLAVMLACFKARAKLEAKGFLCRVDNYEVTPTGILVTAAGPHHRLVIGV